jgi:hypothetical protein
MSDNPFESTAKAGLGNHVAGDVEDGVQRCVVCGGILLDYSAQKIEAVGEEGEFRLQPGPVFVLSDEIGPGHKPELKECLPL